MADREVDSRLKKLWDDGVQVYSISKLGTINNCLYEAYNTYIKHQKGSGNIYGFLGSNIHSTLEDIVNDKATEADLLPAMNEEFDMMDTLGIEFPKDMRGGDSIKTGWVTNMEHFCKTYKSPRNPKDKDPILETENFFLYKTPKGRYMQGYIDLFKKNKDGTISIYDYKTSSMYSGEDVKEHGYQLVTYALAKEQEGFNVKNIAWIFLKYVDITFTGYKTVKSKNKTEIKKTVERKKIGTEMAKFVERDLIEAGYDEIDIEIYLKEFKDTNMFDCLPEDIKDNYKMKPCVYNYEITDEVKQDCIEYIDKTIDVWEELDGNNKKDFPSRSFTRKQKNGKEVEDTFYCNFLCNHRKTCEYIYDFNQSKMTEEKDDELEDLF